MFDAISSIFSVGISVKETVDKYGQNVITISGINPQPILSDVAKVWNSKSVGNYLFIDTRYRLISLYSFFALDFLHTIREVLRGHIKKKSTNSAVLQEIETKLIENTWLKKITLPIPKTLNREKLSLMKFPPLSHQEEFFNSYERIKGSMNLNGIILSSIAGSGKTYMYLALSLMLEADITIAVVPLNSVDRVWEQTIIDHLGQSYQYWKSTSNVPITPDKKFYICHYESLGKVNEFFQKHTELRSKKVCILVDECHNFNENSNRTQLLIDLHKTANAKDSVWGSGTPFKALGTEIIPFLKANDPLFTPIMEKFFIKVYGKSSDRAASILSHRISLISFTPSQPEKIKEIPKSQEIRRDIVMPDGKMYELSAIKERLNDFSQQRVNFYRTNFPMIEATYTRVLNEFSKTLKTPKELSDFNYYNECFKTIRKGYDPFIHKEEIKFCNYYESKVIAVSLPSKEKQEFIKYAKIVRVLFLVIQGETLGHLAHIRDECHVKLCHHIPFDEIIKQSEKKVLIFSSYVNTILEADKVLKAQKYKTLLVYGDTNKDLANIVRTFDTDPSYSVLLATYKSLSTAVPMIMANTIVLINQPFRSYEKEQTIARVERLGQTSQTYVYNCFLDTGDIANISTRSEEICSWSAEQVSILLGGSGYSNEKTNEMLFESYDNDNTNVTKNGFYKKNFDIIKMLTR